MLHKKVKTLKQIKFLKSKTNKFRPLFSHYQGFTTV